MGTDNKTRRATVDFDPADHRWLKQAALDADVHMSDLLRAAVAEMRDDPTLKARVTARVDNGKRRGN